LKKLSEVEPGSIVKIIKIDYDKGIGIYRRLADMGLLPGVKIKVIRKAPLGDPIEFEVRGYNISLRKIEADLIWVE